MSKINELGWSGIGLGIVGIFGAGYLLFKGKSNKRESTSSSEWNDESRHKPDEFSVFPPLSGEASGRKKRKSKTKKRR